MFVGSYIVREALPFTAWNKDYISQTPCQLDMVMWQGSGQWDVSVGYWTAAGLPPAEPARFQITLYPFLFLYSILLVGTWMWIPEKGWRVRIRGRSRGRQNKELEGSCLWGTHGAHPAQGPADFSVRQKPASLPSGAVDCNQLLHWISKKSWLFKWPYPNLQIQMNASFHNNHLSQNHINLPEIIHVLIKHL